MPHAFRLPSCACTDLIVFSWVIFVWGETTEARDSFGQDALRGKALKQTGDIAKFPHLSTV